MFDVDKFIERIHERPAIWEKRSKEYSDKNCRERSWAEVGETMYANWLEFELAGRDEKVKEMKKKWRHIRDNFQKYVNQGQSGDPAPKKKKKYVYAEALMFLLNTMEKRKTSGNVARDEDKDEEEEEREEHGEHDDEEEGLAANNSIIEPDVNRQPVQVLQTRHRQRSLSNLTLFQNELLKKLEDRPKQEEEDADKSFLMSLLPDYKKLNDDEKMDFKFATLQFFRDIRRSKRFENPPPGPNTQSSYHPTMLPSMNPYQLPGSPFTMQIPSLYLTPTPNQLIPYKPASSPHDSLQSDESIHSQMTYESF